MTGELERNPSEQGRSPKRCFIDGIRGDVDSESCDMKSEIDDGICGPGLREFRWDSVGSNAGRVSDL